MKNNKGFSLIELLVAVAILSLVMVEVFAMMRHSSTLYLNGTYEVGLQTEAQQVIQQLEELMIDCDGHISANYMATVSSDVITISCSNAQYIVELVKDPALPYGEVLMDKIDHTSGVSIYDIPMADYVESISLNMTEYTTASRVTLQVNMRNDMYSYTAAKDIYLRNDIGLSGNRANYRNNSAFDFELDVLRYKEYSLSNLFNGEETYNYSFDDGTMTNSDYHITKSGTNYTIQCQNTVNHGNDEVGPYYVVATDPTTGAEEFKIQITTEEIRVGADDFGVFYLPTDASYTYMAYVDIAGISVLDADTVDFEIMYTDSTGTYSIHSATTTAGGSNYSYSSGSFSFRPYISDVANPNLQFDSGISAESDSTTNSIVISSSRMPTASNYFELVEDGGAVVFVATLHYDSRSDIVVRSYGYPASSGSNVMSDAQREAFWDMVR